MHETANMALVVTCQDSARKQLSMVFQFQIIYDAVSGNCNDGQVG
jgi:hypothetical protein